MPVPKPLASSGNLLAPNRIRTTARIKIISQPPSMPANITFINHLKLLPSTLSPAGTLVKHEKARKDTRTCAVFWTLAGSPGAEFPSAGSQTTLRDGPALILLRRRFAECKAGVKNIFLGLMACVLSFLCTSQLTPGLKPGVNEI